MSNVYFIGDLHFGHQNICNFRTQFNTEAVHREFLIETWKETINKRDIVYCLGDIAFTKEGLEDVKTLPGRKILVRGNHDLLSTEDYLDTFEEVYGLLAYKGLWLSHAPIHPQELYGRSNVHGHCHRGGPTDVVASNSSSSFRGYSVGAKATYFNACAEHLPTPYKPIRYDQVIEILNEKTK